MGVVKYQDRSFVGSFARRNDVDSGRVNRAVSGRGDGAGDALATAHRIG